MDETLTERCVGTQSLPTNSRISKNGASSSTAIEIITDIEKGNDTLNMFLNELHDKEIDINSNFSKQELVDIRTAVNEQVHLLAETIGEIEPMLKSQEVIPVGSAREGTQIVRPCEYDYILILEALSKPGAVALKFLSYDKQFMRVTPEDSDIRKLFHRLIGRNNAIKAGASFPGIGLRQIFQRSVARAVILCSQSPVVKTAGTLLCKPTKPTFHGPALPVMFEWQGRTKAYSVPMKISVDLCSALKVDWEVYENCLQSSDYDISDDFKLHVKNVGSILLMPGFDTFFKITLTEAELLHTSKLSNHHIKCYRLLKFIVNGEPLPAQTLTSKIKHKFQDKTFVPSYAIKMLIWHHQFIKHCFEESDLGICVTDILSSLESYSQLETMLKHPANCEKNVIGSKIWKDITNNKWKNIIVQNIQRIKRIDKGLEKVQNTSKGQYNFEKFCNRIQIRGLGRYNGGINAMYTLIIFVLFLSQIACAGYIVLKEQVW